MTIEHGAATPVWRQLAGILRERITSGQYQSGRAIPSEKQLEQEYGISRNTIRKAIALLRDEDLIVTVTGRGSYVRLTSSGGHFQASHDHHQPPPRMACTSGPHRLQSPRTSDRNICHV
jgi:GntR family transcriptional regulator